MNKGYVLYLIIGAGALAFALVVYIIVKLFRLLGSVADKIKYDGGDDYYNNNNN